MDRIEKLGEAIDDLITLDVSGRGVVETLYEHAREIAQATLTLKAANIFVDKLKEPAKPVVITTGVVGGTKFGLPFLIGETDGPLGTVALARAIAGAFKAVPILLTEKEAVEALGKTAIGAGLTVTDFGTAQENARNAKSGSSCVVVRSFPKEEEEARRSATNIFEELEPPILVAIEKTGRNENGVYHASNGVPLTPQAMTDILFEDDVRREATTIGIGDAGNEIGMGTIKERIADIIPFGRKCQCPCGGSVIPSAQADVLLPATVSNWGAYGLVAGISALSQKPFETFYSPQLERNVLRRAAEAGFINISGYCEPAVDGMKEDVHVSMVTLLSTMVEKYMAIWGAGWYEKRDDK